MLLACFCTSALAQVKAGDIISGQVWDDFDPLMMCNVVEIDNNNRIVAHGVTDINGNFSFKIVSPKDKIRISYVGCQTLTLPINKKAFGKIVLKSTTQIQEVVVKAVKKTQSSGLSIPVTEISVASQTIDMKEFEGLAMTSVDEALQGRIAGLDIVANSGNLGAGTTMRLRGVSTITGNANPLIVVNGNVWTNDADADFDFTNANEEKFAELLSVNPEDIESITVLKDASAKAIWGSRGGNGVIEIKTKRGARGKTSVGYSYRFSGSWMPEGYKLLNGDDYTMYMKEAYFNPRQESGFSDNNNTNYMPEINYNPNWSEYNMYNDNTDWVDAVSQFGQNHQHYVSIEGGGEKANFRISGGYDHQTGTIIKNQLDRFTTRVALDYFVSDRIKITSNFDLNYTKNRRVNRSGSSEPLAVALNKMPNLSIYEEDANGNDTDRFYTMNPFITAAQGGYNAASGKFTNYKLLEDQYNMPNPVAMQYYGKNYENMVRLAPEFILDYDLLGKEADQTRLKYQGQVMFQIQSSDTETFFPGTLVASNWSGDNYNVASESSFKSHNVSTRHTLTFQPHFSNEAHNFQAMVRYEYSNGNSSSQNLSKKWLPTSDDITSTLAGGVLTGLGTGAGEWKSQSILYDLHYAYKGKYVLHGTLRSDGSTRFGPERRWGHFPGLSARWNITDEKWMEPVKWLSSLAILPGWGIVGNAPGGEGLYYSKYNTGGVYMGNTTVVPSNIRLAGLRWEKITEYNLGFVFGFFDQKINGDVMLYSRTTEDMLLNGFGIPSSSGFTSLSTRNGGSMRNTGWEFNINGSRIIQAGKFSMDFNVSFNNNRNQILKMDETFLDGLNDEFGYNNGVYLKRVQLNNPLGAIYGFRCLGVYQYTDYSEVEVPGVSGPDAPVARNEAGDVIYDAAGNPKAMYFDYGTATRTGKQYAFVGGDAKYEDVNHDGQINELDIVYLGSSLPKLTGGFGFKFNYAQWSMNLQFNYRIGQNVINAARMGIENMATNNNMSKAVNWRWHNEGDKYGETCYMPRAATSRTSFDTYNYLGSDRFVEEASFLRLNYAQFSYRFDPKKLKNWGIKSLLFSLNLNNVFCLTKYSGADPEINQAGWTAATDGSRTPRSKSFTLSANVKF